MDEKVLNDVVELVLLRRCETQTIEVKAARGGTPRLYDTLSSFSNQADGGIVVFGIDEDAGYEVCGVFDPQRLQKDAALTQAADGRARDFHPLEARACSAHNGGNRN